MEKPKTAPVIHERPKMPRATWDALRSHIIKERRRRQEEEGKAEEYERLKKEKEKKKMMEATSLDETKKQISQLEEKLTALKAGNFYGNSRPTLCPICLLIFS